MSVDELMPLAARVGADVPFFLHGGTAMVHGRGEKVRPMPPADLKWVIILAPALSMPRKTEALYSELTDADYTKGALTRKLEARIRGGGDVPPQFLFNVFDNLGLDVFPCLRQYWDTLHSLGAREIHVAGSGPRALRPRPPARRWAWPSRRCSSTATDGTHILSRPAPRMGRQHGEVPHRGRCERTLHGVGVHQRRPRGALLPRKGSASGAPGDHGRGSRR